MTSLGSIARHNLKHFFLNGGRGERKRKHPWACVVNAYGRTRGRGSTYLEAPSST